MSHCGQQLRSLLNCRVTGLQLLHVGKACIYMGTHAYIHAVPGLFLCYVK